MVYCPRCRTPFDDNPAFCGVCGAPMPDREELTAVPTDPIIGLVIAGRYRIVDLIGRGGMGAVYRAEHVKMGKVVAVKILSGELSNDNELSKRFKREAETASRLTAINTVQVFDFGSDRGMMYLVMEYVEGTDLAELLRTEGALPFERAARILMQVTNSLSEAHEKGIVHRDLKPANILLGTQGEEADFVKVADFGLATIKNLQRTKITKQGTLVGTPYYMSPEHIKGQSVDERADIYALGAVLFKLLTNETPFKAPTMMGVITKHLTELPTPPSEAAPECDIPPEADAVCLKAMRKEPEERYASAQAMKRALKNALGVDSTRKTTVEPRSSAPATPSAETIDVGVRKVEVGTRSDFEAFKKRLKWRKWWRVILLVAAVLVILGGTLAVILGTRTSDVNSESEPNDTLETADVPVTGRAIVGYINSRSQTGDVDWFRIDGPGIPFAVSATISGLPGVDLALSLVTTTMRAPIATADAKGPGEVETLYTAAANVSPVYLAVQEIRPAGVPAVQVSNIAYSLVYNFYDAAGLELEPNDAPATAMALQRGVAVGGQLVPGDIDWFSLTGSGGGTVKVSCSEGLDLMLTILYATSNRQVIVNNKGPGQGEWSALSPLGTPVFIGVSEVQKEQIRSTRGYKIVVQ